jgi:hypothetical protein
MRRFPAAASRNRLGAEPRDAEGGVSDTLPGNGSPDIFDEREKAFETKYRLDEETGFRIDARCAHLFGLWAATQLGLAGEASEVYARSVREADLARPNHREMFAKVLADLSGKGVSTSEEALRGRREILLEEAKKQIVNELAVGRSKL